MFLFISFVSVFVYSAQAQYYTVPEAEVEAILPKGFRVCIPDSDGVELFAFHGSINKILPRLSAGDFSMDIRRQQNGAWCFIDNAAKLKFGDTINYWLYVQVNGIGYRRDGQTYTVTNFVNKDNVAASRPAETPPYLQNLFPSTPSVSHNIKPVNGLGTDCGPIILGLNDNISKMQNQIDFLTKKNDQLQKQVHVLEMQLSDKALILRGLNASNVDSTAVISNVLSGILDLPSTQWSIVKKEPLADGSIMFEVKTKAEKNRILQASRANKDTLQNIQIEDIAKTKANAGYDNISPIFQIDIRGGADEE